MKRGRRAFAAEKISRIYYPEIAARPGLDDALIVHERLEASI
jgi:hypothetical protein